MLLLLCTIGVLIAVGTTSPIAEAPQYRLPTDVVPTHYVLDLKLETDAFTTNVFSGTVSITLDVITPVDVIKLHYKDITVSSIELRNEDTVLNVEDEYDSMTDILTLRPDAELDPSQNYILSITYEGILSPKSMRGFYISSYFDNGVTNYLATTQFESTFARQAYPCFDEPSFKATFDVSLTFPKEYNALGNTQILSTEDVDGYLHKVTFQTTPIMSTYLVAFIVSKLTCAQGKDIDGIPTSVCSRSGTQSTVDLALEVTPEILNVMAEYTGYKYASSNITKLTQVAIPDFEVGGMENWGLITYRERDLLWDKEESSNVFQELVVTTIAHELGHQWFGDLITTDWWSHIFLNEGFASYFEYHAPNEVYPEWELTKQFVTIELHDALLLDSSGTTLPLSSDAETPAEVSDRFDIISYSKGGSVLRMLHYVLGLDNFKAGVADYVSANKFSNPNPVILWSSFQKYAEELPEEQALPATILEVMENWTNKSGYPLLTVESVDNDIVISQDQFLLSGTTDTKWYVPVTYTLSSDESAETTTKVWLTPDEDVVLSGVLTDANWIVLNVDEVGFYRVYYNTQLWSNIFEALTKPDFDGITVLNRAQIVDDLLNLARGNKKPYAEVLDLLAFLKNEIEYYPWYAAFNGFNNLLARVSNKNLKQSLENYVSDLMQVLYSSVPFDDERPDDHAYTLRQILALTWACNLNNEDCVNNSRSHFDNYKNNGVRPSRNLRGIVYCNAMRYSDNIVEDFDYLAARFSESQLSTESETILRGFGCAQDENILNQYLQSIISEKSGIRRQDASIAFSSIYTNSPIGVDVVFDFAINNHLEINEYFGRSNILNSLISSTANLFTNQDQIEKLRHFIENTELEEDVKASASAALETAEKNLNINAALEEVLQKYFSAQ